MPDQTYEVTLSDGRKFHVTADRQPTEEEILAHLPKPEGALMASHEKSAAPAGPDPSASAREEMLGTVGRYGGLLTVPAGASGEAMGRALAHPEQWPTLAAGVAAGIAAPVTGGTSLLMPAAAAAGGGGIGSIAKNAAEFFLGSKPTATATDVAKDVAKDAAIQGGAQLAGGAIAKGAGALGRGMYTMALGAPKTLRAEFPGLVQTGIDEGVIPATQAGVDKAVAARGASSQAAENLVAQSPAAQAGIRIPTRSVTQGLNPLRTEVAARPTANVSQDAINAFEANMAASHPRGFSLQDLVKTTHAAQGEASAAYEAAKTAGAAGMDAEANEAIAKRGRGIIEHFVPDVAQQNAKTQALIGLARAMKDSSLKPYVLRGIIGAGSGVAEGVRTGDPIAGLKTGAGTFIATDPRVMGAAGLALARSAPTAQVVTPQALRAALLSLMGNETDGGVSPP